MAQLMPLPITVSCFGKIQIGFTFLVPADPGSPGKGPLNGSVVCVCIAVELQQHRVIVSACISRNVFHTDCMGCCIGETEVLKPKFWAGG